MATSPQPLVPLIPRPLDRGEAFFWFLDQVSSNNFVVIAEGEGSLPEAALRRALVRTQSEHPLLNACIAVDEEQRLCFAASNNQPIPLVIESAQSNWRAQLARHMVIPFALQEAPLLRAYRYDLPGATGWVFALVVHHSIGDGRSASQLLLEVLEHASGVERPVKTRLNHPPLHEIFPQHLHGANGEAHASTLKATRKAEYKTQGKPDEFPAFVRTNDSPPDPGLVSFRLSAEQVERIAERARQEESSVNGAIGAAQLLALQGVFGDMTPKLLSQINATDLRGHLSRSIDHSTPGAYVAMMTSTVRVDGPSSFWQVTRDLTQDIRKQLQRGDGHQFFRLLPPPENFPPTPDGIAAFEQSMAYWPLSNMLSNVGRLPLLADTAQIKLKHVSFALCPNPTLVIFSTASTYQGRMTINVNYEKHRLAEAVLQQIAADFERLLINCTG